MSTALIWLSGETGGSSSWPKLLMLSSVAILFIAGSGLTLTQRLCDVSGNSRSAQRKRKPGDVIALPGNVTVALNAMRGSDADIFRAQRAIRDELAAIRLSAGDLVSEFESAIDAIRGQTVIAANATRIALQLTKTNKEGLTAFSEAEAEAEAAAGTTSLQLAAMRAAIKQIYDKASLASEDIGDHKIVAAAVKQQAAVFLLLLQDLHDAIGSRKRF